MTKKVLTKGTDFITDVKFVSGVVAGFGFAVLSLAYAILTVI